MSKKSRRRNRKILGALGALGALALATRKRNAAIDKGIQSAEDDKGSDMVSKTIMDNMPKKTTKKKSVYQDPIMTGGKGVKQGFRTTSANVQKGLIEPPGLLSQGKIKFKEPVSIIPKKKYKSSAEVQREILFNKAANAQRAQTFDQEGFKSPVEIFQDSMLGDTREIMAKGGGRITKKGVKRGAAKRGFGRAYTKGRK
jgi:hypothetical protein